MQRPYYTGGGGKGDDSKKPNNNRPPANGRPTNNRPPQGGGDGGRDRDEDVPNSPFNQVAPISPNVRRGTPSYYPSISSPQHDAASQREAVNLFERQRKMERLAEARAVEERARQEREIAKQLHAEKIREFNRRRHEERAATIRSHWSSSSPDLSNTQTRRFKHQGPPPKIVNVDSDGDENDSDLRNALAASMIESSIPSNSPKKQNTRPAPIDSDDDVDMLIEDDEAIQQALMVPNQPPAHAPPADDDFAFIGSEEEDVSFQRAMADSLKLQNQKQHQQPPQQRTPPQQHRVSQPQQQIPQPRPQQLPQQHQPHQRPHPQRAPSLYNTPQSPIDVNSSDDDVVLEDDDMELQNALLFSLQPTPPPAAAADDSVQTTLPPATTNHSSPQILSDDDEELRHALQYSMTPTPTQQNQPQSHIDQPQQASTTNQRNTTSTTSRRGRIPNIHGNGVRDEGATHLYEEYLPNPNQYRHREYHAPREEDPEVVHNRLIRREQDLAYEMSLAQDKEKERKAKEEQAVEREKELIHKALLERRNNAGSLIPPEPQEGQGVALGLRMPNGTRFLRRFNTSDTLQDLRNFIESKANECNLPEQYEISTDFPKRTFHDKPLSLTLADAGINGRMLFNVKEAVQPQNTNNSTTTTTS